MNNVEKEEIKTVDPFSRAFMKFGAGHYLFVALIVLCLDLCFFVICLEAYSADNPASCFIFFGYGQIALPFVYLLFVFVEGENYRQSNGVLGVDPISIEGDEMTIVRLNKDRPTKLKLSSINAITISPISEFSLKKFHIESLKAGELVFVVGTKKHYSGYLEDPAAAKAAIEEKMKAISEAAS